MPLSAHVDLSRKASRDLQSTGVSINVTAGGRGRGSAAAGRPDLPWRPSRRGLLRNKLSVSPTGHRTSHGRRLPLRPATTIGATGTTAYLRAAIPALA